MQALVPRAREGAWGIAQCSLKSGEVVADGQGEHTEASEPAGAGGAEGEGTLPVPSQQGPATKTVETPARTNTEGWENQTATVPTTAYEASVDNRSGWRLIRNPI